MEAIMAGLTPGMLTQYSNATSHAAKRGRDRAAEEGIAGKYVGDPNVFNSWFFGLHPNCPGEAAAKSTQAESSLTRDQRLDWHPIMEGERSPVENPGRDDLRPDYYPQPDIDPNGRPSALKPEGLASHSEGLDAKRSTLVPCTQREGANPR